MVFSRPINTLGMGRVMLLCSAHHSLYIGTAEILCGYKVSQLGGNHLNQMKIIMAGCLHCLRYHLARIMFFQSSINSLINGKFKCYHCQKYEITSSLLDQPLCSDPNSGLGLGEDRLYCTTDCCRLASCIASKLHH